MKRVLITGGTGWIGSYALHILSQCNYEVHAVCRSVINEHNTKCTWHQINLLDFTEVENLLKDIKPTHLLHLAWEVTPGIYMKSKDNYLWVQASIGLFQHFIQNGGKRIVVAGTCAEYDWNYGYFTENVTPTSFKTPYATSKNTLHLLLESMSQITGISSSWGRIFFLYGPREHEHRLVSSVIHSLMAGKEILCTHGRQYRDFLHVEDVASALVSLLDSTVKGPVNIASSKAIQVKEVVLMIANKIGRRDLVRLGVIPLSKEEPPFIVGDSVRLQKEVGWKPKYSLESGLENTILWWEEN